MLMDDRKDKSHGTENAEKSMSLDGQRVYNQKPWVSKRGSGNGGGSNALKRKLEPDDQNEGRKKCDREVLLSRLSLGRKNKNSSGEVNKGRLNSVLGKPELQEDSRVDGSGGRGGGLGGIGLDLNCSVNIPKRRRNLVRRKKVEVDNSSKQVETSCDKGVLAEGGKVNGSADGILLEDGNGIGELVQNGELHGTSNDSVVVNGKREKNSLDHIENRSDNPDLLRHLKRDDLHSYLFNGNSVTKKARRKRKKNKETRTCNSGLTVEAKHSLDKPSRVFDDSQDDEENLEANAARMLSSRFDPSCTGFSSGGKSYKVPSENGLSVLISSNRDLASGHPNIRDELDVVSSDDQARILRSRDQRKIKRLPRERRRFYSVLFKDLDSFWVLNRRIQVFWPLDQKWYIGHVIGYDPDKNLHHVKYDDREEEWIDLQHERFKLFLFPSEVPGKGGRKIPTAHLRKDKCGETAELEETINGSSMESEPIISWLARSTHRKSPPIGVKKKKRPQLGSDSFQSAPLSERHIEALGSLEVSPSGCKAVDSASGSVLPIDSGDSLNETKLIAENCQSNDDRIPLVYYRRRFHRREEPPSSVREGELCQLSEKPWACRNVSDFTDSIDLDADISLWNDECGSQAKTLSNDELIWDTDSLGILKLIIPITSLKVSGFDLSSHLPHVTGNIIEWKSDMFMLQFGTLISMWPMIHLEILFVDNVVGLQFVLFEGSMKQAVFFVFLVLAVFCQIEHKERHDDQELPVTSIRFRFSGLQYLEKQLVYSFYNFREISNSKWSYLDMKLKKHCLLTKKLPPSDCTFDNIKALQYGCSQLNLTNVNRKSSSVMNLRQRFRQHAGNFSSGTSARVKLSRLAFDCDEKHGRLPPFALSFTAASTFLLSLHLRLLMERSIPSSSFRDHDPVYLIDHPENEAAMLPPLPVRGSSLVLRNGCSELDSSPDLDLGVKNVSENVAEVMTTKHSHGSRDFLENDNTLQWERGKAEPDVNEHSLSLAHPLDADNRIGKVNNKMNGGPLNGLTIDIQAFVPVAKDIDTDVQNIQHSIDLALDTNDGVCNPNPAGSRSLWGRSRNGNSCSSASANLSPGWLDKKQDFLPSGFGTGPKKPRTQVSYSLPLGGQDYNSKSKFHHSKGFSHKRIRRANEKKTSEAYGTSQRNIEFLSCEANVLVTVGDRGWREYGAKIVFELFDHNEWRLAVKISGDTRYSYKAHQFVQPGTTNRYTHAMMWKGGKDWILEFPDRSQWTTFKEMHEECYNRNFRAASVKNIPIPGVRLIKENDDNVSEVPYLRPSPKYHRQDETDIDIAMDPFRVVYDMDSDDERWIMKHKALDFNEGACGVVSDEMFERTIDFLEKFSYAQQRDHFTVDELEEATSEIGPLEAIEIIYEHWREKRQKKGMPLVRHLQPPLWEKYQQQVKEWEQVVAKSNLSVTGGCQEKPLNTDKPPLIAFCLKPRGLEMPNRGSKQRSQKKLPVGALSNGVPGDADAFHSLVGRRMNGFVLGDDRVVYTAYNQGTSDSSPVLQGSTRVFSPRDSGAVGYFSLSSDGYERNHYPKHQRNKLKKLCLLSSSNDHPPDASYSQRTPGKRSSVHLWSSSEWFSQMHYQLDGFHRHNLEQLDPAELDEFRLRDASSAARHAAAIAKMKRENAQRMLCRADLAMHKAMAAIMTAEAVKVSYWDPSSDVELSG